MHLNSKLLFEAYAKASFKNNTRVLEIGPDAFPSTFKKAVNNDSIDWQTLDIYKSEQLTYATDNEYKFPVPDNTFDIVLSGQVIEHVRKIWVWIKELNRVCKVGGKVITIAPTSWPYHEAPIDCWRIFPEGMKTLYEDAGLKMDLCKFETLETDCLRGGLPGTGALIVEPHNKKAVLKSFIKNVVRRPATRSFDTIAIGTKIG
jgi:SAM-dependent methyltransferase